jgi:hypothetical protein
MSKLKLKLMSVLQSRIDSRSDLLKWLWYEQENFSEVDSYAEDCKRRAIVISEQQKQDKQILKQLIVDERELKELREIRNLMYCEY